MVQFISMHLLYYRYINKRTFRYFLNSKNIVCKMRNICIVVIVTIGWFFTCKTNNLVVLCEKIESFIPNVKLTMITHKIINTFDCVVLFLWPYIVCSYFMFVLCIMGPVQCIFYYRVSY